MVAKIETAVMKLKHDNLLQTLVLKEDTKYLGFLLIFLASSE